MKRTRFVTGTVHVAAGMALGWFATPAWAARPTPTPTPEYHAVQLLQMVVRTAYPHTRPGLSDTGLVASDFAVGVYSRSGGDCTLYQPGIWDLGQVGATTTNVAPTPLQLAPPGQDGIRSSGLTAISPAGGFASGWAFREWYSSDTCQVIWNGGVWVRDESETSWSFEPVEACDAAGDRLFGETWGGETRVAAVNDNGLATGHCYRDPAAPGAWSVPVYWTRPSTPGGMWELTVLDADVSHPDGYCLDLNNAGQALGRINGNDLRAAIWQLPGLAPLVVTPGTYNEWPSRMDAMADIAGQAAISSTVTSAAAWVHDGVHWTKEILDGFAARDISRVNGTGLNALTAVGQASLKRGHAAVRWKRGSSGWTRAKLEDLDDTSLTIGDALAIDQSGRIIALPGTSGTNALIPTALLE